MIQTAPLQKAIADLAVTLKTHPMPIKIGTCIDLPGGPSLLTTCPAIHINAPAAHSKQSPQ